MFVSPAVYRNHKEREGIGTEIDKFVMAIVAAAADKWQ